MADVELDFLPYVDEEEVLARHFAFAQRAEVFRRNAFVVTEYVDRLRAAAEMRVVQRARSQGLEGYRWRGGAGGAGGTARAEADGAERWGGVCGE